MLITVTRTNKTGDGVFGNLQIDTDPFKCVTMERLTTLTAVGTYDLFFMWSEHFQQIMPHVIVPGRTAIEIHWANYPSQLDGCTALGTQTDLQTDSIEESKDAWVKFVQAISDQPAIKIKYVNDYGA